MISDVPERRGSPKSNRPGPDRGHQRHAAEAEHTRPPHAPTQYAIIVRSCDQKSPKAVAVHARWRCVAVRSGFGCTVSLLRSRIYSFRLTTVVYNSITKALSTDSGCAGCVACLATRVSLIRHCLTRAHARALVWAPRQRRSEQSAGRVGPSSCERARYVRHAYASRRVPRRLLWRPGPGHGKRCSQQGDYYNIAGVPGFRGERDAWMGS